MTVLFSCDVDAWRCSWSTNSWWSERSWGLLIVMETPISILSLCFSMWNTKSFISVCLHLKTPPHDPLWEKHVYQTLFPYHLFTMTWGHVTWVFLGLWQTGQGRWRQPGRAGSHGSDPPDCPVVQKTDRPWTTHPWSYSALYPHTCFPASPRIQHHLHQMMTWERRHDEEGIRSVTH